MSPAPGSWLELESPALVLVCGPEGGGGGALVERLFAPEERVRAQELRRALGATDARDPGAWTLLLAVVTERLERGRFTVVELEPWPEHDLEALATAARRAHLGTIAVGLTAPARACRAASGLAPEELAAQRARLDQQLAALGKRKDVRVLRVPRAAELEGWRARPLPCDRRELTGPFDLVGDVHGCWDELRELLARLGYERHGAGFRHPARTLVFLGDLVDRGPACVEVLRAARASVAAGHALCVLGNHDEKLRRHLEGHKVTVRDGLAETLAQLAALPASERAGVEAEAREFIAALPEHLVLAGGRLVAVHGAIRPHLVGRGGARLRALALYGDTTGEQDASGLPERRDWAASWDGAADVVYGHTPVERARWRGRTACVDQGAVFGGALTALRWPEREFVSVPARWTYVSPRGGFRPALLPPPPGAGGWSVP
ncbi:MAG: metallophosphoesterase [Planctomycetota bacterium]